MTTLRDQWTGSQVRLRSAKCIQTHADRDTDEGQNSWLRYVVNEAGTACASLYAHTSLSQKQARRLQMLAHVLCTGQIDQCWSGSNVFHRWDAPGGAIASCAV